MLNEFVNNSSDEELVKDRDKSGLVQKEIQVHTKNGVITRKQWVKASEAKGSDAKYKSGDLVTVNGKSVKILKIMPDDGKGVRYQVEKDDIISHVSEEAISGKLLLTTR